MNSVRNDAFCFEVANERLVGVMHAPADTSDNETGVLVVVGGPQYRVGSHRQFLLLARHLAGAGLPVFRFDYRGMGDSGGEARDFRNVGDDIRAAIDAFVEHSGVARVVLWGLCDAASASLMYAPLDPRVAGLVLLNPWVHSEETEAKVRLRTYYWGRLRSAALWRKLARFEFEFRDSAASLWRYICRAFGGTAADETSENFVDRMRASWEAYEGQALLIMSGQDMTAEEFRQLCRESPAWRELLQRKVARTVDLAAANHTFARAQWRDAVAEATAAWVRELS